MRVLAGVLSRLYSPSHQVVLYQAAQLPIFEPSIDSGAIAKLP